MVMVRSGRLTAPRAGYSSLQTAVGGARRSGIQSRPGMGWLSSPQRWTGSVLGGKPLPRLLAGKDVWRALESFIADDFRHFPRSRLGC